MRRDIGYDVAGFDSATWVRPGSVNAQGQFVRDRMSEPYELGRPKIKPWKRNKKRKEKKGKGTKEEAACSTFVRQAHSFFLFGMSLPFSPRPLVREADERDHVGPFVSRFPISVCIPEDHDEAEHRSSSTKDGISCHF